MEMATLDRTTRRKNAKIKKLLDEVGIEDGYVGYSSKYTVIDIM